MKSLENTQKREKKGILLDYLITALITFLAILAYILLKIKSKDYSNDQFNSFGTYLIFFENALIILISFLVTYFFIKITKRLIENYLEKIGRSKENIKLFLIVYGYFVWIVVIFLTFSLFLKQGASLITSIGLIGFGLTLALQKPILNFVGWITIIFGKAYHIGDIVSINNITGKVYDIRVMYTSLSELDVDGDSTGKSVAIPNEFVFTYPVKNFTKGTKYIWDNLVLHITYKSNWKKATKIVEEVVQNYYDEHIKKEVKETLKNNFQEYEKVVVRFGVDEKGFFIKALYMVDFDKSNKIKREITEILLDKLKKKDISLGKTENVS